ncbi:MAG: MBL fold metallo-hydrolase, partial [Armatimonadota bacterium]
MLITTLGTSHGNHTYCRFHSSTLFEIGDRSYLLDAGDPAAALMIRAGKDFDRLKAIFITHMHEDHVSGLPGMIKALLTYPQDGKHTDVFLSEASAEAGLDAWLTAQHLPWPSDAVTVHTTGPGDVFDDGVLHVAAEPTQHMEHPDFPISFAYILRAEGKRVVYTGDLSADFSDFPRAAQDEPCDVCICEVTHYDPRAALPTLAGSPIGRLILTHVHDPWHGEGEDELREIISGLP